MRPASRSHAVQDQTVQDRHGRPDGPERAADGPPHALTTPATGDREPRSGYGEVPGAEFPGFVYVSMLVAFAWIVLASWLAFAGATDADLALGIVVVLSVVFFALPIIIRHAAVSFSHPRPETRHEFLGAPVETATGPLTGASAWLQVLIIPVSLALAATLIGGAFMLVR